MAALAELLFRHRSGLAGALGEVFTPLIIQRFWGHPELLPVLSMSVAQHPPRLFLVRWIKQGRAPKLPTRELENVIRISFVCCIISFGFVF